MRPGCREGAARPWARRARRPRLEDRSCERDRNAHPEGQQERQWIDRQACHQHRPRAAQEADDQGGEPDANPHAKDAADDGNRGPLPEEEAHHLAAGQSRRTQQADLSRLLTQRHGQRVGDQEGTDHQRHEPEQERDPGEALLGAAELELGVRDCLHDERLGHLTIEGRLHIGFAAVGDLEVDVGGRRRLPYLAEYAGGLCARRRWYELQRRQWPALADLTCSRPAPSSGTMRVRRISPARWPMAGRTSPPTAP